MKSPLFMLDTNIASFIIRGANDSLQARLKEIQIRSLCISTITQGELFYGLALKPEATRLKKLVEVFLNRQDIIPWDYDAAKYYGVVRASLKKAGNPLSILDRMIAAHALSKKAVLITNDTAFTRVEDLLVEDWSTS